MSYNAVFKSLILTILISNSIFANEIRVAVATNVSYAIKPLIKEFNKTNNTKVKFVLGSSGKLTAQIKNAAPYDIFLSANMKYPNYLYEHKIAVQKPVIYAQGTLAIFSAKKRDLKDIFVINRVKRVALANPKTAPYGKAAYEAIVNAKLIDKNIKKIVYAENISQTVQYALISADIGIIAKSSLYAPPMLKYKEKENFIEIDKSLYEPIKQGITLLNTKKEVKEFYDFILSKKAKIIFKKYGYIVE